jgi:hypothetical protein
VERAGLTGLETGSQLEHPERVDHNRERMAELHPAFTTRVLNILTELEGHGLKPRILVAWRSPGEQRISYMDGRSMLRFGYHNITGPGGEPEALAVDIIDDDHPDALSRPFFLRLARAARAHGCETGIRYGLPQRLRRALDAAIAGEDWNAPVKLGWEPEHVRPADVTIVEARAGRRPEPEAGPGHAPAGPVRGAPGE